MVDKLRREIVQLLPLALGLATTAKMSEQSETTGVGWTPCEMWPWDAFWMPLAYNKDYSIHFRSEKNFAIGQIVTLLYCVTACTYRLFEHTRIWSWKCLLKYLFIKRKWLWISLAWRNSNKKVSLSFKRCGSSSVAVMRYGLYANGFRFDSDLDSLTFFSLHFFKLTCYLYGF